MNATQKTGAETFAAYAQSWIARRSRSVRPRTQSTYAWVLGKYVFPAIGRLPVDVVARQDIRRILDGMAAEGLAPQTIRLTLATITTILNDAVDAELIASNPVGQLRQRYKGRREPLAVYGERELETFLATAERLHGPAVAGFFRVCARAGLRCGEARGILGTDVDLAAQKLHVRRQLDRHQGAEGPPKGGRVRSVDLSASLARALEPLVDARRSGLLFPEASGPNGYKAMWRTFREVATAAGLPVLSIHSLRHSYASILIARGVSPAYVQRQLGHQSIALTCDLYGSHLPMVRASALDDL